MPLSQNLEDDPSGKEILRDEKTQLIVGCIGSAADIIEFVSETVPDQPEQSCNSKLHLILWLCWSLSLGSKFQEFQIFGRFPRMVKRNISTLNQSKAFFNSS